jgi:hypothetical protein
MVKVAVLSIGLLVVLPCGAQESSSQQTEAPVVSAQESSSQPAIGTPSRVHALDMPTGSSSQQSAPENKDAGGLIGGVYGSGGLMGQGGVFIGGYSTGSLLHPAFPGVVFELGLAGHTPSHVVDGVFAANMQPTFYLDRHPNDPKHQHAFIFLNGGYTRFFATGNAADYGGGVIWRRKGPSSNFADTRFEYREYYLAGFGRQQEVRVSWEWGGDMD